MHSKRIEALNFSRVLWNKAKEKSPKVAFENPVSVVFPLLEAIGAEVFYTQPWEHGHGETKKTGFALHGLSPFPPTNIVEGREQRIWKMPPGPTRKRDRSVTFPGIAAAMVRYWGRY